MAKAAAPQPVKLIVPMLAADTALFGAAQARLAAHLGEADYVSAPLPFGYTHYYEPEFGPGLLRQFIALRRLIDPGSLAEIKTLTNALEEEWRLAGKRRLNLDPGYLDGGKLVLATTKNHSHRIYLRDGIYAEVTLIYRHKGYVALPWTYPDYASEDYQQILREVRALYLSQLRALDRSQPLTRRSG
ncbi:MAG: DUF4416 family protein [Chloroflexota bacterium]